MPKRSTSWKSWCRLCAAKECDSQNDDVFIIIHDAEMSEFLQRYFGVMLETEPQRLCQRCFKRLQEFQSFAQHVEKVQAMYIELGQLHATEQQPNCSDLRRKFDFIVWEEEPFFEGTLDVQKSDCETHLMANVEEAVDLVKTVNSKETDYIGEKVIIAVNKGTVNDVPTPVLSMQEEYNPSVVENSLFCNDTEDVQGEYVSSASDQDKEEIDVKSYTVTFCKPEEPVAALSNAKAKKRRPHACELCKRRYATFSRYRRHMRMEHKQHVPEDFQCNQCTNTFTTAVKLEWHMRTHLPLEMKKDFPCKICAKKFTTPYVLNKHVRAVHDNEKPYICEECGASLKSGSSLKTHMLTHTNERPFKCERCCKYFKQYPALRRHMESHAAEKLICTICGYELSTRGSLRRHMVVHSDVKHYKCEFCAQEFKRAEGYKNHLLLHTGLKPYICNFCSRTFAHGSNCRSHLKKAHPEELAAFEQESEGAAFTNNVPRMEQLKAMSKTAINIYHVQSKSQKRSALPKAACENIDDKMD